MGTFADAAAEGHSVQATGPETRSGLLLCQILGQRKGQGSLCACEASPAVSVYHADLCSKCHFAHDLTSIMVILNRAGCNFGVSCNLPRTIRAVMTILLLG